MFPVKPKKSLGQHFLADRNIAQKITGALSCRGYDQVVEIGPGMGVLTEFLLENNNFSTALIEIDRESAEYLRERFPGISDQLSEQDILQFSFSLNYDKPVAVIGNFPYNISSQIFFKILENKNLVTEIVCMLQKEVAERITSPPGSKVYGILSVLLQAFYDTELLFSVGPRVFIPPPKVQSAVIRLTRKTNYNLDCNEDLFIKFVKAGFNQRRKMLRNSLAGFLKDKNADFELLSKRPEQLGVQEFIRLTNYIESNFKN
jgi:16S rRNA (adenine1518-N6/adenine1519-N6)-dimethyltransferase